MRTKNSFKNVISIVLLNILIGILGFFKVRIFIQAFSNDIYSLNQLFYQIFGYIVIADLGFGLLLNKKLYDAFAKNDKNEINNIYSTSCKFYNILGIIIILISIVVSFIVHYLTKASLSNIYIQLIFLIFIIRNTLDYFFIAPRLVMEADQKSYKINHLIKGIKIIETIIEIALALIGVNYVYILLPGIVITLIIDLYINKKVYKEYPWLENNHTYNKKYLKGTKDLIYLKLSGLMNSNTDIILISTFINPLSVIIYTSYSYITKFITDTIYVIASAITPSYANALIKENKEQSYNIFSELNILFLFIACFCTIMLFNFLNNLIYLWIGEEFLVSTITLALFCIITFQSIGMKAITITINGLGLFKETKKATVLEAIINLLLSVILIHYLGLMGVLIGTIISYYATSFIQNSYYIYKNVFQKRLFNYLASYIFVVVITIIIAAVLSCIKFPINSVISFIIYVLLASIIVLILIVLLFTIAFKSFRNLEKRCYNNFIKRL